MLALCFAERLGLSPVEADACAWRRRIWSRCRRERVKLGLDYESDPRSHPDSHPDSGTAPSRQQVALVSPRNSCVEPLEKKHKQPNGAVTGGCGLFVQPAGREGHAH